MVCSSGLYCSPSAGDRVFPGQAYSFSWKVDSVPSGAGESSRRKRRRRDGGGGGSGGGNGNGNGRGSNDGGKRGSDGGGNGNDNGNSGGNSGGGSGGGIEVNGGAHAAGTGNGANAIGDGNGNGDTGTGSGGNGNSAGVNGNNKSPISQVDIYLFQSDQSQEVIQKFAYQPNDGQLAFTVNTEWFPHAAAPTQSLGLRFGVIQAGNVVPPGLSLGPIFFAVETAQGNIGAQATPAGGNGGKTTATDGNDNPPATEVAQGIQKAGPTDSLTRNGPGGAGATNMALPTFGAIGTDVAPGTLSGSRVGVATVVPGPLTTEVYTTTFYGSGTNGPYTSIITMTTRGPSMTVTASLQTIQPSDHSVPVGVIAGVVVAALIIVAFLVGWCVLRRRQYSRLLRTSLSSSTPLVDDNIAEVKPTEINAKEILVRTQAPVTDDVQNPFADTAAIIDSEKGEEPPVSPSVVEGTSRSRSISRKPVPESLFLPPKLPIAEQETISTSRSEPTSGTNTPRRRKHGSLGLFPAPPRSISRPSTPTSESLQDSHAIITGTNIHIGRTFTPPPPPIHPSSSGYSSDPETRRRSLRSRVLPGPRPWGLRSASNSGPAGPIGPGSFEPRLNVVDPFADPVRRPWPATDTGANIRSSTPPRGAGVTSPIPERNRRFPRNEEEPEKTWYVSPTTANRIGHGKRGSIFQEDI